jgi:phosphoglycerate dehydrogenase-like enzyme
VGRVFETHRSTHGGSRRLDPPYEIEVGVREHPMSSVKIVIPGDDPPQIQGSPHLDRLRAVADVVLHTDRPSTPDEQLHRMKGAHVLLNSRSQVKWPGPLLRQLPDLKMIAVCGIGTDAIDLDAARERNLVVSNIGGVTAPVVAEHALALMLAVARRTSFYTSEMRQGRWASLPGVTLWGKTLGVIGAGSIAVETARLARAIGMEVLAWTFHPSEERARKMGAEFVELDELLSRSDVVSVHVKLTAESRGLVGAKEIGRMKRGALLVNTARGPIVDSAALVDALRSGHLGGAGLDVYEKEPLPGDHPLLACEQIVLTPHSADLTPEGLELLNRTTVENILAYLDGRPRNRVV